MKKDVERISPPEMVDQGLHGDARPHEDGRAAQNLGVGMYDLFKPDWHKHLRNAIYTGEPGLTPIERPPNDFGILLSRTIR
jgi:hypothetical protein